MDGQHEKYLERVRLFKTYGYDIAQERDRILACAMPLDGAILEVGTGKGHFCLALAQKGVRLISVDISAEEQKIAKSNAEHYEVDGLIEFRLGNAEALDFADDQFDAVLTVNMVHHLADVHGVVDELARVAKPGGKVVVSDFNRKGMEVVGRIHASEGRVHPEGQMSVDEVAQSLSRKGFVLQDHDSGFHRTVVARKPLEEAA